MPLARKPYAHKHEHASIHRRGRGGRLLRKEEAKQDKHVIDIHPRAPVWTAEDDKVLRDLHHQLGGNWDKIANQSGRSSGACQQRWTKLNKISKRPYRQLESTLARERDNERDTRYQYDVQEEYTIIFLFGKKRLKPADVENRFRSLFPPGEERQCKIFSRPDCYMPLSSCYLKRTNEALRNQSRKIKGMKLKQIDDLLEKIRNQVGKDFIQRLESGAELEEDGLDKRKEDLRKSRLIHTKPNTPISDFRDFICRLPDKGDGCRVVNKCESSQCYITSLSDMEVERVKNDPIVSSVEDDELPEI